ncbi:hypothetical protein GCM10011297_16320 [Bacterioplanes sanyensis]|uniref:STAS domain-containing protein n=1 Tax=Bacterioplanes sanyensis TaxID=1249553 RepID=UPI0016724D0D|nr:STAS domain-containing protein [Bacterioplanes sanyensis]GGY44111.1 hypothetical protein GCM10011297_16320 [Bacterioplanes sanyensis]
MEEDGKKYIKLDSELTIYTAAEQRDQCLPLSSGCRELILDASALQEVDGAGVQLLLLIARECHEQDIRCALVQPPEVLKNIVALLRLDDICWFETQVGEAA